MFTNPVFKPHFRVQVLPGEGVFLSSELSQKVLLGSVFERVVPFVDGRSVAAICDAVTDLPPAKVFHAIGELDRRGYLAERDVSLSDPQAALFSLQGIAPELALSRLRNTVVPVRAVGDVDPSAVEALLRALQVRSEGEGTATLDLVVADSYLRSELAAINEAQLRLKRPWMLVRPGGRQVWLGPIFHPGETACWGCLAERLRANSPIAAHLEDKLGNPGHSLVDPCRSAATLQASWGLAASAVIAWITGGGKSALVGTMKTLNLLDLESQKHALVRLPFCGACRSPAPSDACRPVELTSRPKAFTQDGGHRVVTPQQTLDRYLHHVSPLTGAVSALEAAGIDDDDVCHVYFSGHNPGRPQSGSIVQRKTDLRSVTSGKGMTAVQARASALCEALERYSGIYRRTEPRRWATARELGEAAIHPNDVMGFSDRQYRERDSWNPRFSVYNQVPPPFDPDQTIEWTPVWSLSRRQVRYLPTAYCYFGYPQPLAERTSKGCSNGNAAGNTIEEAILQGLLELVERDSVALWWYSRVRRPAVDLRSFELPYLAELEAFLKGHHREMWVLDITSDLGIPAFAALARRTDGAPGQPEEVLLGFGAHLDAKIALLRAVTEMNQMLIPLLGAAPGEIPEVITDKETRDWLASARLATEPYLVPLGGAGRRASDFPRCATTDLKDDVLECQRRLEERGLELLVLDQTRDEIGLPVVKVIVPGLRHFWARFGPGRLYDVPAQLGWVARPLDETELNPVPMFI